MDAVTATSAPACHGIENDVAPRELPSRIATAHVPEGELRWRVRVLHQEAKLLPETGQVEQAKGALENATARPQSSPAVSRHAPRNPL